MKKPIFFKVFGSYVVIILVMSAVISVFSFSTIRTHYEETLALELENVGRALNARILTLLEKEGPQELDAFLKRIGTEIHARLTVIDTEGGVVADSEKNPAQMENHKYRPEVVQALEGKIGRSRRFSYTVEEKMLYVGLPLDQDGRRLGVLRLSLLMRDINILQHSLRMTIGRTVVIMAAASLVLALLFSLQFTRPIHKLTKASRQAAAGNFGVRFSFSRNDEFRELGEAFDRMAGQITRLFDETSRQKEELLNMIASVPEAITVFDKEGRIILANESFKKMIGLEVPEGKFYWEVIRKPGIQDLIGRAKSERRHLSEEVSWDNKLFLCAANYLGLQEGVLLVLQELTGVEKTDGRLPSI